MRIWKGESDKISKHEKKKILSRQSRRQEVSVKESFRKEFNEIIRDEGKGE